MVLLILNQTNASQEGGYFYAIDFHLEKTPRKRRLYLRKLLV